jgi:hypothetical protein
LTQNKFAIVGCQLRGRGLTFDVESLVSDKSKLDPEERRQRLAEIGEAIYLQGRASVLPSWDDRFDLSCAVEVLLALVVVVGPNLGGERHRRAADAIARLLQEQGEDS